MISLEGVYSVALQKVTGASERSPDPAYSLRTLGNLLHDVGVIAGLSISDGYRWSC